MVWELPGAQASCSHLQIAENPCAFCVILRFDNARWAPGTRQTTISVVFGHFCVALLRLVRCVYFASAVLRLRLQREAAKLGL